MTGNSTGYVQGSGVGQVDVECNLNKLCYWNKWWLFSNNIYFEMVVFFGEGDNKCECKLLTLLK